MAVKVVIIDDEPWTREVVRCLGKWDELGLQVVGEASDGESGLELIRQIKPEIVITDVHMPHLNGIDLIHKLREEHNNAFVIFISGYDEFEYARSALVLGAVDYLLKPIKEDELNSQLKKCADTLQSKMEEDSQKLTFTGDFINASWAKDFYSLRSEMNEALRAQQKDLVEKRLRELEQLIRKESRKEIGLALEQMVGIYYSLTNVLHRYINSCGYSIQEVFGENNTSFVFGKHSTLEKMLTFEYELYSFAMDRIEALQRNKNSIDIDMIKRYIDENYCDKITLEETASRFYISKEYLSKIFKQRVGEGFSEYVTARRMEKAKELICDLRFALKDVCEMVGYVDMAHFYKTFKRYFGKTPGNLRDELNIYNKTDLE